MGRGKKFIFTSYQIGEITVEADRVDSPPRVDFRLVSFGLHRRQSRWQRTARPPAFERVWKTLHVGGGFTAYGGRRRENRRSFLRRIFRRTPAALVAVGERRTTSAREGFRPSFVWWGSRQPLCGGAAAERKP